MESIKLMVDEHEYIKRMLVVLRKYSYKLVKGQDIALDDLYLMIDFVRNFADKHHHGKEEEFLFTKMMEHQGPAAEKLVRHGMLVEHDLGRLHMTDLEAALDKLKEGDDKAIIDVIANAVGYASLLARHIDKENDVVYKFAERGLPKGIQDEIDEQCKIFEENAEKNGVREKYIGRLEELEAKA